MALTPYTVNFVDDADKTALIIEPNGSNGPTSVIRSLDVELVGQGSTTWGEKINENIIHLLENFSSPEDSGNVGNPDPALLYSPTTPTRGQLWFNSTNLEMYTYDGLIWKQLLTSAASGGSTTFTGTLETTLTTGDIFLADNGHVRETLHDGGGNWNFRHNSYYDAGDKYGTAGSGAVSVSLNSDSQDGIFIIRTAVIGTNAGDPITWGNTLQLTTTDLKLNGNKIYHEGYDGVTASLDAGTLDGNLASAFQLSLTGAVTTVTTANLTANRVTVSNGAGKIAASTVTTTELDFLSGTTSSVQDQLITIGTTVNPPAISLLAKASTNNMSMVIDGVIHTSAGHSGSHDSHLTGRGTRYTNTLYGIMTGLKAVNIQSTSPVVDHGTYGVHAYALLANGELYTWGWNSNGGCGLGHTSQVGIPTLAASNVTNVYAHPSTNSINVELTRLIIQKTDGYLYGTGWNGHGHLGLGDTTQRTSFTQLPDFGTFPKAVFNLGARYGCLVVQTSDDRIKVSGFNGQGQLGIGSYTSNIDVPVDVTDKWDAGTGWNLKQATGGFGYYATSYHSEGFVAMLLDDGVTTRVRTSGNNSWRQLGNGTTTTNFNQPQTPDVGIERISKIAAYGGAAGSMSALAENGDYYSWGYNAFGQVGDGTTVNRTDPLLLFTGEVVDIYSDGMGSHTYPHHITSWVKKTDGHLYACGYNRHAEGGHGFQGPDANKTFLRTLLPIDVEIVELGRDNTTTTVGTFYALTTSGKIYTWGYNGYHAITGDTGRNQYSPIEISFTQNK